MTDDEKRPSGSDSVRRFAEDLRETVGKRVSDNESSLRSGLGRAARWVDQKTGGKYADQIGRAENKVGDGIGWAAAQGGPTPGGPAPDGATPGGPTPSSPTQAPAPDSAPGTVPGPPAGPAAAGPAGPPTGPGATGDPASTRDLEDPPTGPVQPAAIPRPAPGGPAPGRPGPTGAVPGGPADHGTVTDGPAAVDDPVPGGSPFARPAGPGGSPHREPPQDPPTRPH